MPQGRKAIIQFLDSELGVDAELIADDTELLSSGLVDSLAVMDLVNFVSAKFGVRVRTSDITLQNFNTIPSILKFSSDTNG